MKNFEKLTAVINWRTYKFEDSRKKKLADFPNIIDTKLQQKQ